MEEYGSGYGKKPLWQWILIYVVVGGIVYALIYYFVISKNGGYQYPQSGNAAPTIAQSKSTSSTVSNNSVIVFYTAEGFSPASTTIKTGDHVNWVNKSGTDATVNSDPHPVHTDYPPLNLGKFATGTSFSLTFDKPGTYGYHNHLNPSQKGTIIVE